MVYARTQQEHDQTLRPVLLRSFEKGIRFNEEKLDDFGILEVPYFEHIISSQGLKPDQDKIHSVHDMQPSKNKSELETILSIINYLYKFAPNWLELTSLMQRLLDKDAHFSWDQQ